MKTKMLSFFLLFALVLGGLTPVTQAQAQAKTDAEASTSGFSPEGMLNPDGTLNLDGSFTGALNLDGYDVNMDPALGPIFSASGTNSTALGQWTGFGNSLQALSPGSRISAIGVSGSKVFLGGYFLNASGIPAADHIVVWDSQTGDWSSLGNDASGDGVIKGEVRSILVHGTDVYVGGGFVNLNNIQTADYVAKWDMLTNTWSALGSNGSGEGALNSWVYCLAMDTNGNLYAGGSFTAAANLPAGNRIAKWNTTSQTWSALGNTAAFSGTGYDAVFTIAVDGTNEVYVGGSFRDVDGIAAADYLAFWSPFNSTWSAVEGNGSTAALNGAVYALIAIGSGYGGALYVGGDFTDAGGVLAADHLAYWSGFSSSWLSFGSKAALNDTVSSISLVNGSDVYVAGNFTDANGLPAADGVAKWSSNQWSALGSNGAGDGSLSNPLSINALAVLNGNMLVGGSFNYINNNGTLLSGRSFASWDGADWSSPAIVPPDGSIFGQVQAIAILGKDVYVGGNFVDVVDGGIKLAAADYIVKWDGAKWSALGDNGSGNGALIDDVNALAVSGTDVYVGGWFTDAAGLARADYIAKWDTIANTWSALGNNAALTDGVYALAVDEGGSVYVGGRFVDAAGINAADYVAKWSGTNWSSLGNSAALSNNVYALTMDGGNVYVGGYFTDAAGLPAADYIAKWDTTAKTWSALGSNGGAPSDGSLNSGVRALAIGGSNLYVGGDFSNVNNNGTVLDTADYIAKWDGKNWSALGSNGSGDGALNSYVLAIAINGTDVYAGGYFTDVAGAMDHVAKWNGKSWSALGNNGAGDGSINNSVYTLKLSGSALYVGGDFSNVNNSGSMLTAADYFAAYGISPTTATFKSTAAQDGWILAKTSANAAGGSMNVVATTLRLGDDAAKKQYRDALSFSTKTLPDNAIITRVTLKLKKSSVAGGGDPITLFSGIMVDIQKGTFGTASLQLTDFAAAAHKTYGPFNPPAVNGWYTITLTPAKAYINKVASNGGLTQIRLRFKTATNNNTVANYLSLFSGNAPVASRPQLIIQYYMP